MISEHENQLCKGILGNIGDIEKSVNLDEDWSEEEGDEEVEVERQMTSPIKSYFQGVIF